MTPPDPTPTEPEAALPEELQRYLDERYPTGKFNRRIVRAALAFAFAHGKRQGAVEALREAADALDAAAKATKQETKATSLVIAWLRDRADELKREGDG